MKKILSLVMALALVLVAVSAFASDSVEEYTPSLTKEDYERLENQYQGGLLKQSSGGSAVVPAGLSFDIIPDNDATKALIDAFAAAQEAGDVLSAFPEAVKAQIPADLTVVNEIVTALLSGNADGVVSATVGCKFTTAYEAGSKVCMAFGISADQWVLKEGTAQTDGSINVTLDKDLIDRILNKPITLVVVSAQ